MLFEACVVPDCVRHSCHTSLAEELNLLEVNQSYRVCVLTFQLVFALIAALAIAVLLLKVQPFVDDSDDHVSTMAQVCIHVFLSGERILSTLSLAEFFRSKLQPVVSTRSCGRTSVLCFDLCLLQLGLSILCSGSCSCKCLGVY